MLPHFMTEALVVRPPATSSAAASIQSGVAHLPVVSALRGVAALYVVLFHMTYVPKPGPPIADWLLPFVTNGYSGVPLFFIISAFTLCHTLQGRVESHPTLRFYARRVIRIMPLFYFVLLVSLGRNLLRHRITSVPTLLLNLSVLFNLVPTREQGIVMASWSIGVEMLFYAMFPWLFRIVNSLRRALLFFAAALILSGIFWIVTQRLPLPETVRDNFFRFSLARSLPCFATGMVVYWAYRASLSQPALRRFGYWLVGLGATGFIALLSLNLNNSGRAFALHSLVYGALVTGLLFTKGSFLVNRVTERLGDVSYSLYLWHPLVIVSIMGFYPVFYAHFPKTLAWFGCLILTLAVLVPVSLLSYRLIEEPSRKAGLSRLRRWN